MNYLAVMAFSAALRAGLLAVVVVAASLVACSAEDATSLKPRVGQLLADPGWARGLQVIDPKRAAVVQGVLQPSGPARVPGVPAWRLVQWNSRATIAGAKPETLPDGSIRYNNAVKSITLGPVEGESRGLSLLMRGDAEYEGRLRKPEEPWAHLLLEQAIADPPPLARLKSLRFRIVCRLRLSEAKPGVTLAAWHCGQFQAFLTIQNVNRQSPGYGDFVWFGVPIFDSRYRQPIAHTARDTGGSEKFIYTPAGSVYSGLAAADGKWLAIDKDLLPLIREAVERAWREGFLKKSREWADFRPTSLNLGWELTGPLDVDMQFRDLSLEAVESQGKTSAGSPGQ